MRSFCRFAIALALIAAGSVPAIADDPIQRDFTTPPLDAKPMTWWHWMNGNVTKEGITADLEAMKRIGLGGAQIFNVAQGEAAGPVVFMSPEWKALTQHAISEAHRLGLRLAIHNCAGWSESGGPWITPEQSMQKVVWSETYIHGNRKFSGALVQPQTIRGYYRDIAVLAFPTLPGDGAEAERAAPTVRAGSDERAFPGGRGRTQVGLQTPSARPARIDRIEERSGMRPNARLTFTQGEWPAAMTIVPDRIVDLSSRVRPDGQLEWDVPAGDWTVIRFGHTSTGQQNAPAPASGRGLECDKMSRTAVEAHFNALMAKVIADAGPLAGKSLKYVLADSWEAGTQNWTPAFREEFQKRMGYDLTQWLPTLTGRVVGSLDRSERFLWDFRRVIADLIAENHYGLIQKLSAVHGMQLTAEAPGIGMPTIADELQCKGRTDMPMGEFWLDGHNDSKEAAVSAHIYGRKRASAEAFTAVTQDAKWMKAPYDHKAIGDLNFCRGINLFVFHRYAMQPWLDRAPGMTMGPWGTNFERTNTWWEQARAWMQYLSRSQALLQDGLFVADACYFYGEGAPNTIVTERSGLTPPLPAGYDYDVCDTDVLMTRMTVKNGRIVLPDGMSYHVLALPNSDRLTPAVLRKIRDMIMAGATVVGPRPDRSPSLSGYPACDAEVAKLASEIWAECDGKEVREHRLGRGKVVWGRPMEQVLLDLRVLPDVTSDAESGLAWIHRRAGDAEIYFVSNQDPSETTVQVTFRAGDKRPELWSPDTGRIEAAARYVAQDGMVTMPLHFDPSGSVFVVFRNPAAEVDPLRVVELNGRDVSAGDGATPPGVLTIHRAIYGVDPEKGQGTVDVTDKVSRAVRNGRLRLHADNMLAGDPALDQVKRTRVEYSYNGARRTVTIEENGLVELPIPADLGAPGAKPTSPTEITLASDNSYLIHTTEGGAYEFITASGRMVNANIPKVPEPVVLGGPWTARFPPKWGAPEKVVFEKLISWTDRPEEGVRHFSGTAAYEKDLQVPSAMLSRGKSVWLDLGAVHEVAEVRLNGRDLGILWKPPYRVDITRAAHPGTNRLEVRVTNLWPNRMIGDAALPPEKRFTYATFQPFKPEDPLLPSGLVGPVTLLPTVTVHVR